MWITCPTQTYAMAVNLASACIVSLVDPPRPEGSWVVRAFYADGTEAGYWEVIFRGTEEAARAVYARIMEALGAFDPCKGVA